MLGVMVKRVQVARTRLQRMPRKGHVGHRLRVSGCLGFGQGLGVASLMARTGNCVL